jgi:N-hydroxyarylamine O-acetyltransferase
MLDLPAYLARIGYFGSTEPSAETLRNVHRAHMFAVPFENLDIHLGSPIVCDEARFLHKIIHARRGGFCYELNGAFAALLRVLGFRVTLLSARVARPDGNDGAEFDHLCLRVRLPGAPSEDSYLADVGFGDSFIEPLRFAEDVEQAQFGRAYRLKEMGGRFHMEMMDEGSWNRQYSFTLQPRELSDFVGMCHYHQTSPDSHFTRQRICTLPTPQGRITLSNLKLIETSNGQREERGLADEAEWRATLRELFQVELADGTVRPASANQNP